MRIIREDLSSEVYKRLKEMILANEIHPGEKLKQEQIAAMFGISRMPLHKAFQMLEYEMLVENVPRRGFYVTVVDNTKLIDAFEVREALEGVAARRLAAVITKSEIDSLKSLFTPFAGIMNIDIGKYGKADQEFHDTILKTCGNKILGKLEIISNITLQTYRGGLIRGPEETLEEHLAIIEAIEERDARKAEHLMREHSKKTCELLKNKGGNTNHNSMVVYNK